MNRRLKKATHEIQGYTAVIPKIQNIYPIKEARRIGWEFGFKYESGVFKFFSYKNKSQAEFDRLKLLVAIDNYYTTER